MWPDCREMRLDLNGIKDFFMNKAGIVPTFADEFGLFAEGFIRINIACSREFWRRWFRKF